MSDQSLLRVSAASPATFTPDAPNEKPDAGMALCLSGGGYRAMVFHLGALWRLNELGLLKKLKRVSSVSGGSITAAMLGLRWKQLAFQGDVATNLESTLIAPIRGLAGRTIDAGSIIGGALLPGTISEWITGQYEKHLYGEATLQDLPADTDGPRFVINATNVQTGTLWRFSRPFMGDYLVGLVRNPVIKLAEAVAASSAFPPVLSPAVLEIDPTTVTPEPGTKLNQPPFTSRVILTDGGVYDNMGIETAWKRLSTVFVSDAGAKIGAEAEPKEDWARHAYRILDVVDNQVRCLRKRQIIAAFKDPSDDHDGTYWSIRSGIADYGLPDTLPCPAARTQELAAVPTRLKAMDSTLQQRLINWGYAVGDAALRRHCAEHLPTPVPPPAFPYPQTGV